MENVSISTKQREFLHEPTSRINLLEGSVRSGKTWISLVAWALFVASQPRSAEFLMVGKTLTTLKRNCLGLLQDLEPEFKFSISQKQAYLYGRKIWLEGANDEQAESKIRGMTLTGVYIDELTLIPQSFYYMALSRLSTKGAKLFATTNPDSPLNYVYTEIVLNEGIDRRVTKFHITDNPYLDPDYVEELAKEYRGVFYQRYFLGEWVLAEGLVYPMFDNSCKAENKPRQYTKYCLSMDYGIQNPTAILLWGYYGGVWYLVREYYHSGRDTNEQKTDEQYYEELCRLSPAVPKGEKLDLIIDPSATSFIALCRQKGSYRVLKADNSVIEGIQHVASALSTGMIKICENCTHTIQEFGLYSWDADANEDRVIKENDHCLTGDTKVHTLFGMRSIKNLVGKIGFVWSYSEKKKKKVLRPFFGVRMTQRNQPIYKITCANGKTVCCTGNHKILTTCGWKQAKYLTVSDEIIDIFVKSAISSVTRVDQLGKQDVYNMEVLGTHNFAVNGGLIVHNCMDAARYFVQTKRIYRDINKPKETYRSLFGNV